MTGSGHTRSTRLAIGGSWSAPTELFIDSIQVKALKKGVYPADRCFTLRKNGEIHCLADDAADRSLNADTLIRAPEVSLPRLDCYKFSLRTIELSSSVRVCC